MLEHNLTPSEWKAMTPRQQHATRRWMLDRARAQEAARGA